MKAQKLLQKPIQNQALGAEIVLFEQLALRKPRPHERPPSPPPLAWWTWLPKALAAAISALNPPELVIQVAPGKAPIPRSEWDRSRFPRTVI